MTPNLTEKIAALIDAGMTQALIEDKTGIPQYRVSRLGSGATKNPRWSDAELIDKLHNLVVTQGRDWSDIDSIKQTEEV